MHPLNFIWKHFWAVSIIVTGINWLMFRKRAQEYIKKNPQLAEEYAVLFKGYLFWMNLPWLGMGIGCTLGGIPSVWHYFRPREGNPYVLAWFGFVFLLWALGTFWLFFKGGAETLARHPGATELRFGLGREDITSPRLIKVVWLVSQAGGIVAVVLMWSVDIPVPNLR